MATESDLIDLLDSLGDRAPSVEHTLDRLALQVAPTATSSRRWLAVGAAVAAVAVSVLVSVAVRGDDPNGAPASGGPGPTVDHASYPLPLDAYYASAKQMQTLQRAQLVLTRHCAQAHGVTLPAARVPTVDPQPAFVNDVANNIRPLTLSQARAIGYGSPRGEASGVDAALAGLTPRQLEIVQGRTSAQILAKPTGAFLHDGGCLGQAERTLLTGARPLPLKQAIASSHIISAQTSATTTPGGQPGLFDDDATLASIYVNAARFGEADAAMRQAQHRWASCMAAHNYPDLRTTTDTIAHLSDLRSASAKREAVQDVQCKQSTGFMTVWVTSMTKAQNAVIAAHRPQLTGFKQRLVTRMANAAAALE